MPSDTNNFNTVSGSMPMRMLAAWLPEALVASSPAADQDEHPQAGLRLRADMVAALR